MELGEGQQRAPGVIGSRRDGKKVYSTEHKRRVVQQCLQPGASVAGVALAHGVNANLVRKWIANYQRWASARDEGPALLPVTVGPNEPVSTSHAVSTAVQATPERLPAPTGAIEIEMRGGRIRVTGTVDVESLRSVIELLSQRR